MNVMNQISRAIYVPIVMITLQVGGCASSGIEGPQLGGSGTHVGPAGIELDTAARLSAISARTSSPTNPIIASVRIETLFTELARRTEAETEIEVLADEIEAEAESRQATIEQWKAKQRFEIETS